ncbi:TIGR03084 family metal-binding protein [Rhizohabitans arisaemae]|uniref:TIGR03084 family metal-binding protein n=1 Tax=Rhizohabitans arisaemae TaxID=2720610 RepID=UPI0024B1F71E|nr:TIGR03084 family metal-binding protein [Rhizohabitans arisaemae]
MIELDSVLRDLTAEGEELDRLVSGLGPEQWRLPSAAPGWTVHDQIAHLTFVFGMARTAAAAPDAFNAMAAKAATVGFTAVVNGALKDYEDDTPEVLLDRWREARKTVVEALAAVPAGQTVPWLVNPLPPAILACAGIMEQFAHGQDIADVTGIRIERTDRLRHLVGFVVLTRDFGYLSRNETPPATEFRFEITSPSGELWTFGPEASTERITGSAVDLCLLATRRRHRDDVDVVASGAEADHYLDIAQCYRGPAGEGRRPGRFAEAGA